MKLRVGVLMGGKSSEREVSFNSGRTICDHLDIARYQTIPLFQDSQGALYLLPWHFLHRGKTTDFSHRLEKEAERISWDHLKSLVDFVYLAMHGRYAEDGTLQGVLEVLNIPYLGSGIFSSALGMNKSAQKDFLRMNDFTTAAGICVSEYQVKQLIENPQIIIDQILQRLTQASVTFPLIVKPNNEGSSFGVSVVHASSELIPAIMHAATIHKGLVQAVIIEDKIEGMEFSCILIADKKTGAWQALPPTEIVADKTTQFYDYEQKYMPGKSTKFTPARCDQATIERIQKTCIQVAQILQMRTIGRIDGIVAPDGNIVIIDPNTSSGMAPSSFFFIQAAQHNMSHTDIINHLIESEIKCRGINMEANIVTQQQNKKRLRVAVLLGGASNEREISLESGRNVFYKLSPHDYQAHALFVTSSMELYELDQSLLVRNCTKEIETSLKPDSLWQWNDLKARVDFVFNALHGGLGENGGVQGMLEMLELPYNGSGVLASALCMDKFATTSLLKFHGSDVPLEQLIARTDWQNEQQSIVDSIIKTFEFPLIVKPHDDGCSVGVQKATSLDEVIQALEIVFSTFDKPYALVQELIAGMELTVGVIGNDNPQALPPSQAVSNSGVLSIQEKFLPGAGENQTPAPLPQHALTLVQQTIERAYTIVGCKGYARIDCFYQSPDQSKTGTERVVILEVNTLPGLTPATCLFHQAAEVGMRPMNLINRIISLGLELHTKNSSEQKIVPLNTIKQPESHS